MFYNEASSQLQILCALVPLSCILLYSLFLWLKSRLTVYPLPPGPKPLPFIGNAHQMPQEYPEKTYFSWGRQFGDLVYVKALNKPAVVTNSVHVARNLMEKRGTIYSDRPRLVLMNEMLKLDGNIAMLPYGERYKKTRRWIHDSFSSTALVNYRTRQRREVDVMLQGFLSRPEAFSYHFARFTQALILDIAYGHMVNSEDDEYIELGEKGNHAFATVGNVGGMLVDFFPILRYYPTWLPGAAWKVKAIRAGKIIDAMHSIPYEAVKAQLKSGTARLSFTATLVERHLGTGQSELSAEDDKDIRAAAGTLYSAGTETMASTMTTFILAMILHPEIYLKAQKEMDHVVGASRLPGLDDMEYLPYLSAIIKETYRFHPPLPLGLPHYSSQEDEYSGYRIPNNTLIIGNVWGMSRDEDTYPDPEKFRPERFIVTPGLEEPTDPKTYVFGFGRRLCPGKDFADGCVSLVLANIVATMDISKAKDANGREITPKREFYDGFASRPKPFQCVLTPRSQQAASLIRQQDTA